MTVAETIELLKTFPPDALMICSEWSDYRELEADDVGLISNDTGRGIVRHNGRLMIVHERWNPAPADAVYITAVGIG